MFAFLTLCQIWALKTNSLETIQYLSYITKHTLVARAWYAYLCKPFNFAIVIFYNRNFCKFSLNFMIYRLFTNLPTTLLILA